MGEGRQEERAGEKKRSRRMGPSVQVLCRGKSRLGVQIGGRVVGRRRRGGGGRGLVGFFGGGGVENVEFGVFMEW